MPPPTIRDTLRNRLWTWMGDRAAWPERIVNLVLIAILLGLITLSATVLSFWQSIFLWSVFVVALILFSWQGSMKLLGPVLFYDMLRTSRRNRYFILRMLYAGFLFFILSYMVLISYVMEQEFKLRQHAVIAETFFLIFMMVQLTLVVLLTPAYVAGAISEEKDRKTIEFMLATDLRNREIVFSKLFSRLANISLLLITGLPILSILQFLGGVDPDLMLSGFAATALTMLGIGSLSILFSTLFKRPRDAISLTYLILIAYGVVATTGYALRIGPGARILGMPLWFGEDPWTLGDLSRAANAGNPIAAVVDVLRGIGGGGGGIARVLPGVLERYTWFHLVLAAICITWSVVRVRSIALKQTTAGTTATVRWWQRLRPAVGNYPMFWKEIFIEGRTKLHWLIWLAIVVLLVLTFGSGFWVIGAVIEHSWNNGLNRFWRDMNEAMNIWFRFVGTFVACLMILLHGVRASTTITSERERDTMDALVASPLSAESMLFAKFFGNLLGMKIGWLWYAALLAMAVLTGGIHPLGVPVVLAGCVVYALFTTLLGMAFSIYCRSSLQSAVLTVLATIFLGGGHWLITSCFCMPLFSAVLALLTLHFRIPREMERFLTEVGFYFVKLQAGVTPPFVFPWCSFSYRQMDDEWHFADRHFWEFTGGCILGLFFWLTVTLLLWFFVLMPKFRRITRRIELDDA